METERGFDLERLEQVIETSIKLVREQGMTRNDGKKYIFSNIVEVARFDSLSYENKQKVLALYGTKMNSLWPRSKKIEFAAIKQNKDDPIQNTEQKDRVSLTDIYRDLADDGFIPNNRSMTIISQNIGFAKSSAPAVMSLLKKSDEYVITENEFGYIVKQKEVKSKPVKIDMSKLDKNQMDMLAKTYEFILGLNNKK